MSTLGIAEIGYRLSTWDGDRDHWLGTDENWENAISALRSALEDRGLPYFVGEGEAAFYGPKIDYQIRDAMGREFTNNTIQVDFQLPDRFQLEYVAEDGSRKRPVMVHRGAFGSMERMFAYLIEKYAGAFPTWLHPVQVVVIPITDSQVAYAEEVAGRLRRARLRVEVDARSERMNRKIREAQARKVPYMAIVGAREAESGRVSVRNRAGEQADEPLDEFDVRRRPRLVDVQPEVVFEPDPREVQEPDGTYAVSSASSGGSSSAPALVVTSVGLSPFSIVSFVIAHLVTSLRDGSSNITSKRALSIIDRSPRAPVSRSSALSAISQSASSVKTSSIESYAKKRWY
jgi:hypothetical protein